ncbi:MAG TPA: YlxR family protein [Propionibacteriaceae bacterium]|nr:YlxR family protein [Propionibacteriaceae bacterium]
MPLPERTCVGCRARAPISELVRVVAAGTGVEVDLRRRMPGRGAWVHPRRSCVVTATRRKAWARALRVPGIVADAEDLCARAGFLAGEE